MAAVIEELEEADLTASEVAMVTANEQAGLVSQIACHFCGMQFDVKKTRSLRAHIEDVHVLGDTGYMCGVCCEEFTSRKAVETHMSTFHRAPKPLGCGTCGETFRVRNLLLKHIDNHTQQKIDANKVGFCYCGECFEFFESVTELQVHAMTHREQAMFVCGACGMQTQHRYVMVKHLECHVITNLLAAGGGEGEPAFETRPSVHMDSSLLQGAMEVTNIKQNNKFGGDITQVKGEVETEEEDDTSYKCGVCQASFPNLTEALGHAEIHQEEESQVVEGVEVSPGMEFSVLLQDRGVDISADSIQDQAVVTQNIERVHHLLPSETFDIE